MSNHSDCAPFGATLGMFFLLLALSLLIVFVAAGYDADHNRRIKALEEKCVQK